MSPVPPITDLFNKIDQLQLPRIEKALESIIGQHQSFHVDYKVATDELQKLTQEFSKMTRRERASIAKIMLEGAVKYARRKKKATVRSARHN